MKPRIPKIKVINGHKYTTSGFGYRSRRQAEEKAKNLRKGDLRARVETFSNKMGNWYVVYVYDPREYYK